MRQHYRKLILLTLAVTVTPAYAGWDQQCLNDCFKTNHACNYCDYQCRINDAAPATFDEHSNEYKCPF